MQRRIKSITAGVAGVIALTLMPGVVAQADVGDGQEACNTYEICFGRNSSSDRYQRHFYYGDTDHGGNHWYDNTENRYLDPSDANDLEDDAYKLKNRDGSCDVKVIDWNGAFPDVSHTIANNPTSASWVTLKDGVRNENNQHTRVNC